MIPLSKRQKQVGKLLLEHLNSVFVKLHLTLIDNGMISIEKVVLTPNLAEARIYLSIYPSENADLIITKIIERQWEIKKHLVVQIRGLRKIPELIFYVDDSLERMEKMENLFKGL